MINWNDYTPLTRHEFNDFINDAIPFMKDMESKNNWDFFINDVSIKMFADMLMQEAFEINNYEDNQEYNPKVQDMDSIWDLILEADWVAEDERFRNNKKPEIWQLVLDRVNVIADSVF